MRRILTVLLVLVTAPGLATAGLLRPCDCEHDAAAACHATPREAAPPDAGSCCCHGEETGTPAPDGDGCGICCKPTAPMERAETPVTTSAPDPVAAAAPSPTAWPALAARPDGRRPVATAHGDPPWRLAPEGLAVFLD